MNSNPLIIITGNIVKPELKYGASGAAYVKFSIPINEREKNESTGKWEDVEGKTSWYRCIAFNQLAENIAESCTEKGTRVTVIGRIKLEKWTNNEGVEQTSAEIMVDDCSVDLRFNTASVQKAERSGSSTTAPPAEDRPAFL